MEIKAFDKHARSMKNINLALMNTTEEVSRAKVPEQIGSIIHKELTLTVGLSQQAIIDYVLT